MLRCFGWGGRETIQAVVDGKSDVEFLTLLSESTRSLPSSI